jgi:hypothetical protein
MALRITPSSMIRVGGRLPVLRALTTSAASGSTRLCRLNSSPTQCAYMWVMMDPGPSARRCAAPRHPACPCVRSRASSAPRRRAGSPRRRKAHQQLRRAFSRGKGGHSSAQLRGTGTTGIARRATKNELRVARLRTNMHCQHDLCEGRHKKSKADQRQSPSNELSSTANRNATREARQAVIELEDEVEPKVSPLRGKSAPWRALVSGRVAV